MNNKPVAWTDGRGNYFDKYSFSPVDDLTPLYTHPADLTDEEIQQVWNKVLAEPPHDGTADRIGNFARAILRKAQEK